MNINPTLERELSPRGLGQLILIVTHLSMLQVKYYRGLSTLGPLSILEARVSCRRGQQT